MRIAYVNRDEVNLKLAARIAAKFGAVVCNLVQDVTRRNTVLDASVYNLDGVERDLRSTLIQLLSHGAHDHPIAVHGYDLTDNELDALRRNDVMASRRLDADLLRSLWKAVRRRKRAVPTGEGATDLTWVNLVK